MAAGFRYPHKVTATWQSFKTAVKKVDRNSLLVVAAMMSADMRRADDISELAQHGITSWNIADVARTSLAYGSILRQPIANRTLVGSLSHMNALLVDEAVEHKDPTDRLLARIMFEQFPNQRSEADDIARAILLFGSAAEYPDNFIAEAMTAGWFERLTGGVSFDDYVGSIFFIYVTALTNAGGFTLDLLDRPNYRELEDVLNFEAVRRTFTDRLVTTVDAFKKANREAQDSLPDAVKKFAFNPLSDKPFISDVAPVPIAPSVSAIIKKAAPPAIYHLAWPTLRGRFTRPLGFVFQHYAGRQLSLVEGTRQVLPEVKYKVGRDMQPTCDWFLDLPDLLVLIECKARQPNENLRIGGDDDWLDSATSSINKGITQLNRSNADIGRIGAVYPEIDPTKPRVGLVVTLEPFYLEHHPLIRSQLLQAELPTGVISIGDLESLVLLNAEELSLALRDAAAAAQENVMHTFPALTKTAGRRNPLIESTWNSIGLFQRVEEADDEMSSEHDAP